MEDCDYVIVRTHRLRGPSSKSPQNICIFNAAVLSEGRGDFATRGALGDVRKQFWLSELGMLLASSGQGRCWHRTGWTPTTESPAQG